MIKTKICTKCKRELPATIDYFHRQCQNKSGLRSWCKECRSEYSNHTNRLRRYKITVEEYDEMYDKQYGRCAICGIHQSELERVFCVDHNHKTGKVRGLLCNDCNSILGYCKENISILSKSIVYLEGE